MFGKLGIVEIPFFFGSAKRLAKSIPTETR